MSTQICGSGGVKVDRMVWREMDSRKERVGRGF